jgi:pyruvate,water dikinase
MIFIKTFKNLSKDDILIAGGKGASLSEMTQAKISVPQGFVVLASAFDKFLEESDCDVEIEALLHKVNLQDVNSIDHVSSEIRNLILDANFPKDIAKEVTKEFSNLKTRYVAVRSSATAEDSSIASWAGELETYLNTTKLNLLENIKKCWTSLFTPRAILYRLENNLHKTKISVAVVVQKMIQSEISGICFTVHPITKDHGQIVIEAGYGLGEAIVGGIITPDTYIVHKIEKVILDKNISKQEKMIIKKKDGNIDEHVPRLNQEKQKLNDRKILELAEICRGVENHYKIPQDIEWAFAKNKFYILQSRPITTL